jgi:hypothetical protein
METMSSLDEFLEMDVVNYINHYGSSQFRESVSIITENLETYVKDSVGGNLLISDVRLTYAKERITNDLTLWRIFSKYSI